MFDATKLLGDLMASRAAPSASGRLDSVTSQQVATGGPLASLGSLLGGGGGTTGAGAGGLGGLLGQLMGGVTQAAGTARTEVEANNPVAVGGLGALAGAILGGGKGAVGGGLMAVLGSLAVSALQKAAVPAAGAASPATYAPPAAATVTTALPTSHDEAQANARLLLKAMISAAKADGHIDSQEMEKIMGQLQKNGSEPEAQQFVLQEMNKPVDIAGLAAEATTPQLAVQVYAASLLAVEVDTPAEQQYFASLAQALRLPPAVIGQINHAMGLPA